MGQSEVVGPGLFGLGKQNDASYPFRFDVVKDAILGGFEA